MTEIEDGGQTDRVTTLTRTVAAPRRMPRLASAQLMT